jgi:hypothetical protein
MTAKKQKEKDRRRARKLAEQAWDAVNADNLDLAVKIIRRAVDAQPDNPVLWNDQGALLMRAGEDRAAEKSFLAALSLAADYAEPYAHLASLRVKQGRLIDAVAFQEAAVRFAPDVPAYAERLAAYRALTGRPGEMVAPAPTPPAPTLEDRDALVLADWRERLAELDWHAMTKRLTRDGCLLLAGLLDAGTCARLRALFDEDERFAKTVIMDREDFGRGTYRYFRAPIPPLIDGLRRAVYPHAARIANEWQELLGSTERFPDEWEGFRDVCRAAGQESPTPILLKYEAGGFNALHRDLRGAVYFPLQLAVLLSPRSANVEDREGFEGGDFLLCDVPQREKGQRKALPAGLGDAVLFCTRDRLVSVGGTYGLQPVMHGVGPITRGTRVVLGVPFHEYR